MAIKSNAEKVMVEVVLDYSPAQAQRIAQQIDAFQRKQAQSETTHQAKLRQQAEVHAQKLAQAEEKALKAAENRQKAAQAKILAGTKSWSAKMTESVNSLRTAIIAMGAAFVSAQVIGGIKSLASEALSLAADLNTFSKFSGLTVEQLSALASIARTTGVDMSSFQGSLVGIAAKLQDARDGATEAQQSFRNLGIDFETATLDEIIQKLFDAAKNTDNLGKISKVASDTGAEQFGRLATYAASYGEAIRKSSTEFGTLSAEGTKAISNLNKQLDTIKARLTISLANAVSEAAPELESALNKLAAAINKIDWGKLVEGSVEAATATAKVVSTASDSVRPLSALITAAQTLLYIFGGAQGLSFAYSKFLVNQVKVNKELEAANRVFDEVLERGAKGAASVEEIIKAKALRDLSQGTVKLSALGKATALVVQTLKDFGAKLSAVISGTAFATLFGWVGKLVNVFAKWSGVLTTAFLAWDLFKARMGGLSWLEAAGYSIGKFFGSILDIFIPAKVYDITDALDAWLNKAKQVKDLASAPMSTTAAMSEYSSRFMAEPGAFSVTAPRSPINAGTKVKPATAAVDPYTKKLQDLAKAQADASKELNHWINLLYSGKINTETFTQLTSDLAGSLKKVDAKELERILFVMSNPTAVKGIDDFNKYTRKASDATVDLTNNLKEIQTVGQTTYEFVALYMSQFTNFLSSLGDITSQISSVYDYLIEAEQNRINAQQAANQQRIDAINIELEMLNRLGFANTMWAKRKQKEAEEASKQDSARLRRLQKERQKYAMADAIINSLASFTTNLKAYAWPLGAILGALSLASGMAQVKAIESQKFALGGKVQGNPYGDRTSILAQGGEYMVNQKATARNANVLESINNGATIGGGRSINITINGNVIGEDRYVRERLIPEISRALEEGHSLHA